MSLKGILILTILLSAWCEMNGQTGTSSLGSVTLALSSPGNAKAPGKSTLPVCTPQNYECNTPASLTYIFTGIGNWMVTENWMNNLIPPPFLTQGFEIVIDNGEGGECVLNVYQTIAAGAKLTVLANKKLRVVGEVNIQ